MPIYDVLKCNGHHGIMKQCHFVDAAQQPAQCSDSQAG
jgi:hypothetical protein